MYLGSVPQLTGAGLPPGVEDQFRLHRRGTIFVYVSVPFLTRHDTFFVTGCEQKDLNVANFIQITAQMIT